MECTLPFWGRRAARPPERRGSCGGAVGAGSVESGPRWRVSLWRSCRPGDSVFSKHAGYRHFQCRRL